MHDILKRLLLVNAFILLFSIPFLYSSDRTDSLDLLANSEEGYKKIETAVKNFGDKTDLTNYEKGSTLINLGKVKIAQTKYLDAKTNFNDYLLLQYDIYKSLSVKYIARTEKLVDEISNELASAINNEKVLKNFETASTYLTNAKEQSNTKHYQEAVTACRLAKKCLLSNYELAGKKLPDNYKTDFADCNNQLSN